MGSPFEIGQRFAKTMRIEHSMLKTFAIRNFLLRKFLQNFQEKFEILKHVFPARKASNRAEIKTEIDINFTATVRDICPQN